MAEFQKLKVHASHWGRSHHGRGGGQREYGEKDEICRHVDNQGWRRLGKTGTWARVYVDQTQQLATGSFHAYGYGPTSVRFLAMTWAPVST